MGPSQEAWFDVNVWTSAKQQFIILTPGMLQEKVDEGQTPGVPSINEKLSGDWPRTTVTKRFPVRQVTYSTLDLQPVLRLFR
jgi:hypothetical protein